MRKSWLLCVLLGTLAWGQASPGAPPPAQPGQAPGSRMPNMQGPSAAPDTSASVPANAVVLTIQGVCAATPKAAAAKGTAAKPATTAKPAAKTPAADCKTTYTKAEFERLADAVAPNVTPQLKKQLAAVLPRLVAFSEEAKKEGMDKTPQFAEAVKFSKMQVLSNALQRKIQKQAADIPQADVEKYYKEHPEMFEQANLERLFVPRTKQTETEAKDDDDKDDKLTDEQKKAKEAAEKAKTDEAEQSMTKVAEGLQARAAKGEDFATLQKEAFAAAGMKVDAPSVNLSNLRRTGLPPGHQSVLDLKVGDVSQVISDAGGHYVYKIVSKNPVPLEQATNEIHGKLQNDKMREMMDKLNNSFHADQNEAYFGAAGGMSPPPHMPRPRPGVPPATPSAQPQTPPPAQPPAAKPN